MTDSQLVQELLKLVFRQGTALEVQAETIRKLESEAQEFRNLGAIIDAQNERLHNLSFDHDALEEEIKELKAEKEGLLTERNSLREEVDKLRRDGSVVFHESSYYVREFHEVFGHPHPRAIHFQTPEVRRLRISLIAEELKELSAELGVHIHIDIGVATHDFEVDHPKAMKELTDLDYVVSGTFVAFGIPQEECMIEVHGSNMSKLDENGNVIYREDGKVLKGPNYRKADMARICEKHGGIVYDHM